MKLPGIDCIGFFVVDGRLGDVDKFVHLITY